MQPLSAPRRAPSGRNTRRDPAPSRVAYRIHRMWLTPLYRSLFRVGIPVFVILTATGWYFAEPANRQAVVDKVAEVRRSVETRPEFMVKLMAIEGASPVLDREIRTRFPIDFPVSSFDLDLDAMRAEIAAFDVVRNVELRVRPGGVLEVAITEREPVLVWRAPTSIELIDATGHRVASLTGRAARPDLPLVAGTGANENVPEALAILDAARPLAGDLRGLIRVGERRWDVALSGDRRILLPETSPVAALEQVLALDQAQDLLARDVADIDMRNPMRPTLRLTPPAMDELRHIRSLYLE
ncbi:cell division protein FtsQ/DivIB [Maritimibacter fusiformis]|uniref:Cell division protein FtsQ n=1 Tax=Maritimibacter fusiformis TaxID=2603819 RepID=A0A5D0RH42_9RHOB|nr:cell division protein FtsQ/DivIB [Maritimibacter fusiformis]TYB80930.1 cell division protein FtsQ [Maritimibacter fusiformis]